MATWRKALVVGLVVLVGAFPVFARVDLGLPSTPNVPQQASIPLPEGKELGDEELLQAEGDFIGLIIAAIAAAAGAAAGVVCRRVGGGLIRALIR